jgi:signal transduction histidine kinase
MTLHNTRIKHTTGYHKQKPPTLDEARPGDQADAPVQPFLDALGLPVALLDECARIIATNILWKCIESSYGRPGASFQDVCKKHIYTELSSDSSEQLDLTLSGKQNFFETTYHLNNHGVSEDFRLRITGLHCVPRRMFVTLEEISDFVRAKASANELAQRVLEIQAEERQRFAAELHDTVGQYFVSLELLLSRLRMETTRSQPAVEIIQEMSDVLKQAQAEVRTLSYLLSPPWVEYERGLEQAVRGFVQGFAKRAGLKANIHVRGAPFRMDQARQLTLFRMVQESLVNVYRHAKADAVAVDLAHQDGSVTLQVVDNGMGFLGTNTDRFAHGAGLAGMRARIRHFGGELHIHSGTSGTTLTATLPTR